MVESDLFEGDSEWGRASLFNGRDMYGSTEPMMKVTKENKIGMGEKRGEGGDNGYTPRLNVFLRQTRRTPCR